MAPQKFAEYQESAPEIIAKTTTTVASDLEVASGPPSEPTYSSVEKEPKKRVLSLAPRTAFALVCVTLVAIIGIVLGAVFGTRHRNHCGKLANHEHILSLAYLCFILATTTETPLPPNPSPTPSLTVRSAIYDESDVTDKARSVMQKGPYIILDMNNTDAWGISDPSSIQCLAILHSNGPTIRTFVACDGNGPFTLVPEYAIPSSYTQDIIPQKRNSSDFAIVSVVWGGKEIRDESVYDALYDYKANGSAMVFGNDLFRTDTLVGVGKTGIIWYTEDNYRTFESRVRTEGKSTLF